MAEVEIGIGKSGRRAYGFDDIAIVPSRRTRDPEDVDITWEIDAFRFDLPLMGAAMDGVMECACIGVPSDKTGEAVKIFIVKKDDSLTEAAVRAHCKECLAGYKVPRIIAFLDELPKSTVGKILRRELRDY